MSTTPPGRRRPNKPKEMVFVEDELGLTGHLEKLEMHHSQAAQQLGRESMVEQIIRDAEFAIADRERELTMRVIEEDGGTSSVAAIDRAVKHTLGSDAELGKMKAQLVLHKNELTQVQADLREHKMGHAGSVASLNAVAAYINLLTATRAAQTAFVAASPY